MLRTHTCGELRITDVNKEVILCGWVKKVRKLGGMLFIDLRDRYGVTQLALNFEIQSHLFDVADSLGREYVIKVKGMVAERSNKNANMPTGDIEIIVSDIEILNTSKVPPFTIEDDTDGGDELRMKYRYLDIRRDCVKNNLILRHKVVHEVRNYLSDRNFLEVETPFLIKSTPEGARDFVVPSRMNQGQFYALPQSPQQFKQLLMVAGIDRYFQIVKCFRDEDLRADRQPEFTQIDCEMSFVEQNDVLEMFEGMMKHVFKVVRGIEFDYDFPRMTWADAMKYYGSDKPDIRFGMKFVELTDIVKTSTFSVFNDAKAVIAIAAPGCAEYTRKELDGLTEFVKRPQTGAKGLVYVKCNADGTFKSSVDKFYSQEDLATWAKTVGANPGDLILVLSGDDIMKVRKQMNDLRLEMGNRLGLRPHDTYAPLWVVDFPLFEWSEEEQRYMSMHHPFTCPKIEDLDRLETDPGSVNAYAYDMVMNGVELGGGSIRIHDRELQNRMFRALGLDDATAQRKFGCLLGAFEYGAPPHAGLAFGLDRVCAMIVGQDSIRDFIAFPKNNSGRDLMDGSPTEISQEQLDELCLQVVRK